ncbi:MAG: hypothetical protein GEU99_23950, partial [Luteitalea sp.]|nr:hypothetical protein [Luteitalea sp.]
MPEEGLRVAELRVRLGVDRERHFVAGRGQRNGLTWSVWRQGARGLATRLARVAESRHAGRPCRVVGRRHRLWRAPGLIRHRGLARRLGWRTAGRLCRELSHHTGYIGAGLQPGDDLFDVPCAAMPHLIQERHMVRLRQVWRQQPNGRQRHVASRETLEEHREPLRGAGGGDPLIRGGLRQPERLG